MNGCKHRTLYTSTGPDLYLNHGLCDDLLIDLQDGILDLLIRETEWSQEDGCMSKTQLTHLLKSNEDSVEHTLLLAFKWRCLLKVICGLTKVLWTLGIKNLQLLHLLLLRLLLLVTTVLLFFGWRGGQRNGEGIIREGQKKEETLLEISWQLS